MRHRFRYYWLSTFQFLFSFVLFLSLILLFSAIIPVSASPRNHKPIVGCSRELMMVARSHGSERFEVPEPVLKDLETYSLVVPEMEKRFPLSPLGHKALRHWLKNPLLSVHEIKRRQEAVQFLIQLLNETPQLSKDIQQNLQDYSAHRYINSMPLPWAAFGSLVTLIPLVLYFNTDVAYFLMISGYGYLGGGTRSTKAMSEIRNYFSTLRNSLLLSHSISRHSQKPNTPSWLQDFSKQIDRTTAIDLAKMKIHLKEFFSSKGSSLQKIGAYILDSGLLSPYTLLDTYRTFKKSSGDIGNFYRALGEFEVLLWFAQLARADSNLKFPEFIDSDKAYLEIVDGHDPYVYFANPKSRASSITLDSQGIKLALVTGPNGRGKSVSLSMPPSLLQWGQVGAPVPVRSMKASPMRFFTSLDIRGNKGQGRSHFQAQSYRSGQIYKWLGETERPTLVIVDEFYRGTTSLEQMAAERATHEDYRATKNLLVVAATHSRSLTEVISRWPDAMNIHVSDSDEEARKFMIEHGPSHRINASEEMKAGAVPERVIRRMEELVEKTKIQVIHPE